MQLAPQPRAYCLAISYGEAAFAPDGHSFTGPAMRRSHRNTEIARNRRPAFERGVGTGLGFLFWKLVLHNLFIAPCKSPHASFVSLAYVYVPPAESPMKGITRTKTKFLCP